jgi:hypothetical protein
MVGGGRPNPIPPEILINTEAGLTLHSEEANAVCHGLNVLSDFLLRKAGGYCRFREQNGWGRVGFVRAFWVNKSCCWITEIAAFISLHKNFQRVSAKKKDWAKSQLSFLSKVRVVGWLSSENGCTAGSWLTKQKYRTFVGIIIKMDCPFNG